MKKIVIEEKDIKVLEAKINSLPVFARNVSETYSTAAAVEDLLTWINSKVVDIEQSEDAKVSD